MKVANENEVAYFGSNAKDFRKTESRCTQARGRKIGRRYEKEGYRRMQRK